MFQLMQGCVKKSHIGHFRLSQIFVLILTLFMTAGCSIEEYANNNPDSDTNDYEQTLDNRNPSTDDGSDKVSDEVAIVNPPPYNIQQTCNGTLDSSNYDESLLTSFSVKNSSSQALQSYPVSLVFPVKEGKHFENNAFHIKDGNGNLIPAQFEVLNRWWGKDNSLRHVQAYFASDVTRYVEGLSDSGSSCYTLHSGANTPRAINPVTVIEDLNQILLSNQLVDISIEKSPLKIQTPAGNLISEFYKESGELDLSFNHENIEIEIEENGPQQSVIKLSSLTDYVSPTDIKHGWAMRIYMRANTELVQVDFQLQNSALNTQFSAPLYFKGHQLVLDNAGSSQSPQLRATEIDTEQIVKGNAGSIVSDNVKVFVRDFWQTFPSGLSVNSDSSLAIELWPLWSRQRLDWDYAAADLFWLDDMRQSYKEIMLDFSPYNAEHYVSSMGRAFQHPPVAVLPSQYFSETKVSMDLGGYMPTSETSNAPSRVLTYTNSQLDTSVRNNLFGQDNYGLDLDRKHSTRNGGGWSYSRRAFWATGHSSDYYDAQRFAKAELNIRPQWLGGYKHDEHYEVLRPSTNPYAGNTWRAFKGHSNPTLTRDYIEGTSRTSLPRDDQHAWFYHVEHAYLMSGNKWIKDWYEFTGEFKKVSLLLLDSFPDGSHRGEGHNLGLALASYQATGDEQLGQLLQNYVVNIHIPRTVSPFNVRGGSWSLNPQEDALKAAPFQVGFLTRSLVGLYTEFPHQEKTLELIGNYVEWNYQHANFAYYTSVIDTSPVNKSNSTSLSFVDAVIWYAIEVKDERYAIQAAEYVEQGIGPEGTKPYGQWNNWLGQHEGHVYQYYKQN